MTESSTNAPSAKRKRAKERAVPSPLAARTELAERARGALRRGAARLARDQSDDGSFEDAIDVGPVVVATQLVLEHLFGRLSTVTRDAGIRALRAAQRTDGSFLPYPHAPEGASSVTALAIAALDAAGLAKDDPARERAVDALSARGGFEGVVDAFAARGDITALFLAASGHVDPSFLPPLPLSAVLTPGLERLIDGRVHAGNLMAFVALLALGDRLRPKREKRSGLFAAAFGGALRGVERHRAAGYLTAWQNPDGGVNQALFATQLVVLAFYGLGFDADDVRLAKSLEWLDRQKTIGDDGLLTMQAIPNDIWGTAMAVLGLHHAGLPQDDPALARAVAHLVREQHDTPQPRSNQRRRGARRTGGWSFQRGNPTMPDCDDAGLVLAALGDYAGAHCSRDVFDAIDGGVSWVRDMQNPGGGWPAYVWNLPSKAPGPMFLTDTPLPAFDDLKAAFSMFLDPPAALGDPATEGVTARVLWGLGACGVGRDDPAVCSAIDYLKTEQCDNGAFWDRWMTCYLPGTATVLMGLAAVGEDMKTEYIARAVAWMKSCQNEDGGFGETSLAFRDPTHVGKGPSMPAVTAFVVCALIDAGEARSVSVERAGHYLLEAQNAEGTWGGEGWVNPYVPPDTFYAYELPSRCMPLVALGKLVRELEQDAAAMGAKTTGEVS